MPAIDISTTTLSPDQIAEISETSYRCEHCSEVGFLEEVLECPTCDSSGKTTPKRAWIFDVDMAVQRTHSDQGTSLVIPECGPPIALGNEYDAALKYPINLVERFAPTPVAEQRSMWNL